MAPSRRKNNTEQARPTRKHTNTARNQRTAWGVCRQKRPRTTNVVLSCIQESGGHRGKSRDHLTPHTKTTDASKQKEAMMSMMSERGKEDKIEDERLWRGT